MITALAPRQRDLYRFMLTFHDENGVWPSMREMAAGIGIKSTNGITYQLRQLKKKGWARQRPNCARGWIAITAEARECEVGLS
jgi:SOS-response transcriptional repressor LexA